ncbi:MAG TPA: cyclase family protein [Burkholderiales bacterium]|nr:cyclase family protein [Burkholderiales bacterium]
MRFRVAVRAALLAVVCAAATAAHAMEPWKVLADTRKATPRPPWPAGDERGMANQIGPATWTRCAWHLTQSRAKLYELSAAPSGAAAQGAQLDALGAGIDKAAALVTSAVLLDARAQVGGGRPLEAGAQITRADIEAMLRAQMLGKRGIQYGDVVYVYTGWGESGAAEATPPGLAPDAVSYLGERRAVAVGLDAPIPDPSPLAAQFGIHALERTRLDELARDHVWTSCTVILPLREAGATNSPVRPVAIGVPGQ